MKEIAAVKLLGNLKAHLSNKDIVEVTPEGIVQLAIGLYNTSIVWLFDKRLCQHCNKVYYGKHSVGSNGNCPYCHDKQLQQAVNNGYLNTELSYINSFKMSLKNIIENNWDSANNEVHDRIEKECCSDRIIGKKDIPCILAPYIVQGYLPATVYVYYEKSLSVSNNHTMSWEYKCEQ
jgi:hypothetical protein